MEVTEDVEVEVVMTLGREVEKGDAESEKAGRVLEL